MDIIIQHPLEECIEELTQLVEEVGKSDYSFDDEMYEISIINMKLDRHPEEAVTEMNEMYSDVQTYLSRVSSILIEVYKEKSKWERFYARVNVLYRKAKNTLLHTRADIKSLRNKELQEASVQEEVKGLVDLRDYIENVKSHLEGLVIIAKEKRDDLDKLNTNLSRQQKVIETLIGLDYTVSATREQ